MTKLPYLYQRFIDDFNAEDQRLTIKTKEAIARVINIRVSKKDAPRVLKDLEKYGAIKRKSQRLMTFKHKPTV